MMKKIILSILILASFSFGAVWSSSGDDGIREAFQEYNNRIKTENNKIKQRYSTIKNGIVEDILNNEKLKLQLITNHNNLLIDETTEKYNYNLEFNKLKLLLNIEGTEK